MFVDADLASAAARRYNEAIAASIVGERASLPVAPSAAEEVSFPHGSPLVRGGDAPWGAKPCRRGRRLLLSCPSASLRKPPLANPDGQPARGVDQLGSSGSGGFGFGGGSGSGPGIGGVGCGFGSGGGSGEGPGGGSIAMSGPCPVSGRRKRDASPPLQAVGAPPLELAEEHATELDEAGGRVVERGGRVTGRLLTTRELAAPLRWRIPLEISRQGALPGRDRAGAIGTPCRTSRSHVRSLVETFLERHGKVATPRTVRTLRERLRRLRATFGGVPCF